MKKLLQLLIPAVALMVSVTSCDKNNTTTTPTNPTNPTNPTTPSTSGPTPVTPSTGDGMWGALIAVKMQYSYVVPQLGTPVNVETQIGVASFYDNNNGNGNLVDAGAVSINSNDLKKETNNSYTVTATQGMTPSTLNLSGNVDWKVAGNNGIPSINYTHAGAFPEYSGTLPSTVSKSSDLEVDLGSKVSGADSVYVVLVTQSKTIIKAFGANPAPAKGTIPASELSGLANVSDNTAYLEVVPFTYELNTTSGKRFAYIKETAVVTGVNIN